MRTLLLLLLACSAACGPAIANLRSEPSCRVWAPSIDSEHAASAVTVDNDVAYYHGLFGEQPGPHYNGPNDIYVKTLFGENQVATFDGSHAVSLASLFGEQPFGTIDAGDVHVPTLFGDSVRYNYNSACQVRDAALGAVALRLAEQSAASSSSSSSHH